MSKLQKEENVAFFQMSVLCAMLNYCMAVYQCALVFVGIVTVANALFVRDRMKAIILLTSSVIVGLILGVHHDYLLAGQAISFLIPMSLASVLVSVHVAWWFVNDLRPLWRFNIAVMGIAAVLDGGLMTLFLAEHFSFSKLQMIFFKEVGFKCAYGAALSTILMLVKKVQSCPTICEMLCERRAGEQR